MGVNRPIFNTIRPSFSETVLSGKLFPDAIKSENSGDKFSFRTTPSMFRNLFRSSSPTIFSNCSSLIEESEPACCVFF